MILEDNQNNNIVSWVEGKNEFIIKDINSFKQVILPKYYKNSNIYTFFR